MIPKIPQIQFTHLRTWQKGDEQALAEIANNFNIWKNLTDIFPYPYTLKDAEEWIEHTIRDEPNQNFAIIVNGKVAGGVGFSFKAKNYCRCVEIGYWLGETYWGKGIGSHIVNEFSMYIFQQYPEVFRQEALVVEYNPASRKVLEKCGFTFEGTMRKRFLKNDRLWDISIFAKLRVKE